MMASRPAVVVSSSTAGGEVVLAMAGGYAGSGFRCSVAAQVRAFPVRRAGAVCPLEVARRPRWADSVDDGYGTVFVDALVSRSSVGVGNEEAAGQSCGGGAEESGLGARAGGGAADQATGRRRHRRGRRNRRRQRSRRDRVGQEDLPEDLPPGGVQPGGGESDQGGESEGLPRTPGCSSHAAGQVEERGEAAGALPLRPECADHRGPADPQASGGADLVPERVGTDSGVVRVPLVAGAGLQYFVVLPFGSLDSVADLLTEAGGLDEILDAVFEVELWQVDASSWRPSPFASSVAELLEYPTAFVKQAVFRAMLLRVSRRCAGTGGT